MRMQKLARTAAAAAAAGTLMATTAAVGAQAQATAPPVQPTSDFARTSGGYCFYDLDLGAERCADTDVGARSMVRDKKAIMTVWAKPRWEGRYTTFFVSMSHPCDGPQIFAKVRNLRTYRTGLPGKKNWNNRISSLVMRKGCKVALYARADFEGHNTGWLGTTGRLGRVPDPGRNWNNAATSMLFIGT